MGNWAIVIRGIGPHHNNQPYDVDKMAKEFATHLEAAGQKIQSATLTYGGEVDLKEKN